MARLFEEHTKRHIKCLDGAWKLCADAENIGVEQEWFRTGIGGETVSVPSVWNNDKRLFAYEGAVWYEKTFYFEGGCLLLSFGAVMTKAEVWLDGNYLGEHYGGFCRFELTADPVSEGCHRLTLRVDNSFDDCAIPQPVVDWYHYGGIIRSVHAHTLCGISVLSNRFDYTLSADLNEAECSFTVTLYNACAENSRTTLSLLIDGSPVWEGKVELAGYATEEMVVSGIRLNDIRLWDIKKPALYTITARTDSDDLIDRVGFRKIEVRDRKLFLNGRETELMGINRHEEHPEHGFAFPQALMARDLALIEDMGCNLVRGSHYPNSDDFVDLLDERGILFWSEIPIWGCGFSAETLGNEKVLARGLAMHREMLKYYYNHPSIVIWGMHNEIRSDTQAGYEMSEKYYRYLKANGGNRLVVYASRLPDRDICLEFTDVICLNLYHGWYTGDLHSWRGALDGFSARQRELGLEDKPIIMSEFGAAAIYGCHDDGTLLWTEEYQAGLITHCLELFHAYPSVVGSLIWQFADTRTSKEAGITRARRFNNKGLLNEYRKPKLAYFAAQKCFRQFAGEKTGDLPGGKNE